ncbi:MAG: ferrous iron transport protein A [Bifidobacteriaceae bacterium]|jgi:ferrous iron transport protein A|nr:ferrous iron transport protein A [Bifidobacteriaceae bacterium]
MTVDVRPPDLGLGVGLGDAPVGSQRWVTGLPAEPRLRRNLEDLGFVAGAEVTVVRRLRGDVIVRVGDSRIAIGQSCAQSIITGGCHPERPTNAE